MLQWLKDYIAGPTHKWWVEKVWRPSWSKFVTLIYGIPAALVSLWEVFAGYANDTTIASYLASLHVPNWVPMVLTSIALVHYIASGR